ncbi:MAG TPA: ABC transporter substrate-binding protein [Euzebyales bacterium]
MCCVALVILLTGCDTTGETDAVTPSASPSASPPPVAGAPVGGTLRWAIARPSAIGPTDAADDAAILIVDMLFDSLTAVAVDGTVRPRAAVRWRSADDGRTWRFTLRRGARYHDGTPVRPEDFAVSWGRTVARGVTGSHLQDVEGYRAVRAGRATRLAGVRALDDVTLEVRLNRPAMDLPALVAHPTLAPVPRGRGGAGRFARNPVGNGPYRMTEPWRSGAFIRVERDRRWRNGPRDSSAAHVGEIVFRIIDADGAYVAFQQGRIDVAPVPAGALRQAQRAYGSAEHGEGPGVVDNPLPALYFLAFAVDSPPWNDPDVRRALSRAIDRQALVDDQRDLALDPAYWIVPPALARIDRPACDSCMHLPSLATAAFRDAGVGEITLTIDSGAGHEQVAEQIRRDLADAGVTLTVRALPFEEYLSAMESGSLGLYRFGWRAQHPTAGSMLEAIVRSGAPWEPGDGANYGGYADARVDALLDRARREDSALERERLWARAEGRALRDQAVVPLFSLRQRTVVGARVRDLTITPWGTATPERVRLVAEPDIES